MDGRPCSSLILWKTALGGDCSRFGVVGARDELRCGDRLGVEGGGFFGADARLGFRDGFRDIFLFSVPYHEEKIKTALPSIQDQRKQRWEKKVSRRQSLKTSASARKGGGGGERE
jgi:hypothetical protein